MSSLLVRAAPVLGFLAAATVLAGLADTTALFDVAGVRCARLARGRGWALWLLVAALTTSASVLLSLDTAVVLVAPVVLALCAATRLPAVPFALLVVWLANTASLLLPVSNLTTLLAVSRLDVPATTYAARMVLPEIAAVGVTIGWLSLVHPGVLRARYDQPAGVPIPDRALFAVAAICCLGLGPAVLLGVPAWVSATTAAAILAAACAVRGRRDVLRAALVSWRVLLTTAALFAAVGGLTTLGLGRVLAHVVGVGSYRTAGIAAVLSNLVNNLPTYLALEPAVPPTRVSQELALLIGTNAGPLVLVTGSVATLLWREQCSRRGIAISRTRFALVGLGGTPLVLLATVAALS